MAQELWRDIVGYEGLYQCSNTGRVRSLDREVFVAKGPGFTRTLKGNILKTQNRTGYRSAVLFKDGKRKSFYVHRLVAETFLPNPFNHPIVNHKDESRDNNEVSNLEWCTHRHNISYGTVIKRRNKKISTPVEGVHIETGEKITFPSMMEAGRNGFSQSAISLCCNDKKQAHKKYKWKFKTERGD